MASGLIPLPSQADDVDAADLRRIAVDDHEPRHVVIDPRQGPDVAVRSDGDERMDADSARDGHVRLDMAVTAQDRVVGDDDPVVDDAIVRDVHVDHQQVVRADAGDPLLFFAAAVDRHPFANDVLVADLDAGRAASERDILGFAADHRERMDDVSFAERGHALNAGMGDQASAAADLHVGPDDAVGTDFHVVGDVRAGIDARRVSNESGHAGFFLSTEKKVEK